MLNYLSLLMYYNQYYSKKGHQNDWWKLIWIHCEINTCRRCCLMHHFPGLHTWRILHVPLCTLKAKFPIQIWVTLMWVSCNSPISEEGTNSVHGKKKKKKWNVISLKNVRNESYHRCQEWKGQDSLTAFWCKKAPFAPGDVCLMSVLVFLFYFSVAI